MKQRVCETVSAAFSDEYVVQVIADYGPAHDLAFAEVMQTFYAQSPRIKDVHTTAVPAFNTIATGFVLGQLANYTDRPENLLLFVNTAPRQDDENPRENNGGEPLVYMETGEGVKICGVDSGYTFTFIRDNIDTFYTLHVPDDGSQFRSRDQFPHAAVEIAEGNTELLAEQQDPATLPEPPKNVVGYIDGFGNIKTSVRQSTVSDMMNQDVAVSINGFTETVLQTDAIFDVEPGEMAFAPGSSGGDDPFMELVVRGGSATEHIGTVSPGDKIEFQYE